MNQDLEYAEMLEIPVSTVNVTKKKSLFKRAKPQQQEQDIKEMVVDSVNERVGAYVAAENLSDPPVNKARPDDDGSRVIIAEMAAVCLLALAIFLTNVFMPSSAINNFISSFSRPQAEAEPTYSELTLSSVVGSFSDAEIVVSSSGVITFTDAGSVYPVCDGTVESITEYNGLYTVKIAHTSTFSSVITGLTNVYPAEGISVRSNIPFAYSDGTNQVSVSMYDGETLLNCYTLAGAVPVWNS